MPLPPLPPGATLDQPQGPQSQGPSLQSSLPPLPPGATLDQGALEAHQQAIEDERINREGPYNWGGLAREAAQGASLYTSDEAEAAIRAAGLWPGTNDPNKTYEQHLADVRQSMADFERRNPNTALAAQFAGGAATAFAAPELRAGEALGYKFVRTAAEKSAAEAAGYTAIPAAKTLAGQIGQSALTGAAYGGVAGFGAGEGGLGNRAESAGQGLETGGVLGAAVPPAMRAAGLVTQPLAAAAGTIAGKTHEDALIEALRREGYTPTTALAEINRRQDQLQFGSNSFADSQDMLADLGPAMQELSRTLGAHPGASPIAKEKLQWRAGINEEKGVPDYTPATNPVAGLDDAMQRALQIRGQSSLQESAGNILARQEADAGPLYRTAYANPATFDVGPVLQAAQRDPDNAALVGPIRQAFDRAVSFFQRPTGLSVPPLTEAVQGRALSQIMRRTLPGTAERGIVESLQNDLASGQFPAASLPRQARFQMAIADLDRLRQTAATDAPRTYPRLTALRERVESASNIAGRPQNIQGFSTVMDTRQFDMSKRALDGLIDDAQTKPELAQQAYVLTGLKKALVNEADRATGNPANVTRDNPTGSPYFTARDEFSSAADLLDAADRGRALLRSSDAKQDIRQELRNGFTPAQFNAMTKGEQTMLRQGLAEEARRMMARKGYGEDVTRMFKLQHVQDAMEAAFPKPSASAKIQPRERFNQFFARKAVQAKTLQMTVRGSDTARIEAGKEDLKNYTLFGRALREVSDPFAMAWVTLTEGLQQLTRMHEAAAIRTARALYNPDHTVNQATLRLLEQRYGSAVAYRIRRMIQPQFRALPGAVGAVAGSQQGQEQP